MPVLFIEMRTAVAFILRPENKTATQQQRGRNEKNRQESSDAFHA
jgi:hypothetical protein